MFPKQKFALKGRKICGDMSGWIEYIRMGLLVLFKSVCVCVCACDIRQAIAVRS